MSWKLTIDLGEGLRTFDNALVARPVLTIDEEEQEDGTTKLLMETAHWNPCIANVGEWVTTPKDHHTDAVLVQRIEEEHVLERWELKDVSVKAEGKIVTMEPKQVSYDSPYGDEQRRAGASPVA